MPIQGLLAIVVSVIIFVILILVVCIGYVKAKPDEAIIITGLGKARVLSGRAGVMIPFIERRDKLDLAVTSIDVKTSTPVPTKDFINVKAENGVRYTVPQKINVMAMRDRLKIRFRVGDVYKDKFISVYAGEERIIHKKKKILAPGEMEEVLLEKAKLKNIDGLSGIRVCLEED